MRVVVAPDSFKGTISAADAASAIIRGWHRTRPHDDLRAMPLADGGEGTGAVLAAAHAGATVHRLTVTGPDGSPVDAGWLLLPDGTAVVEIAAASGLPLMRSLDPLGATTFGTGELIAAALAHPRTNRLLIGLGGSATTDGGAGILQALGACLTDARGRELPRGGGSILTELFAIDLSNLPALPPRGVTCLVDVESPLLGPEGAAATFGPQKGADARQVALLDGGLRRFATVLGGDPSRPGTGAAGGASFGLSVAWGARIASGATEVAAAAGLPAVIAGADIVITGEGRYDEQSVRGKIVGHVIDLARGARTATYLVAGQITTTPPSEVTACVQLTDLAGDASKASREPARWLDSAGAALADRASTRE